MLKRILIIEDDNAILNVLETVLGNNNFDVSGINRTDNIIETIKEYKPDLVLTDYLLFGMDGGHICQLIKSTKETNHIPVILITAYKDLAVALGNFGFDAFITKPFSIKGLLKTIKSFLN
jgi:two-component system, OmpR family, phosphate regulon response regulator PhoB